MSSLTESPTPTQQLIEPEPRQRPPSVTAENVRKRFRWSEFFAEKFITSVAFISVATIVLIFVFVFREALPIFFGDNNAHEVASVEEEETYGEEALGEGVRDLEARNEARVAGSVDATSGEATLENLLSLTWQPVGSSPKYGLIPLVVGSFKVTFVALFIGAPLAILAALFTAAFAPPWARETIKPMIELLAGFPSVVIGFFALVSLATVMQQTFGYEYRLNALLGGMALALTVIPVIYTVAEDALNAVPRYLKEASLALGATSWQTALFVTLPAATPGVFAAVLLGFGRAFGETMIVLMATGNAALVSPSILEPVRTMSATIGAEMAEVVFGETHYHVLFLIGAILFVFTFALNAIAEVYIRQRLMRRFRGV
ncbi:MAG TPA: phosphate ABC transporter permease subunit PstC [Bacteroidota bacterium]|nr:phosphate ABC transporter permease subunit PstC [Bacteroidota bacterium]